MYVGGMRMSTSATSGSCASTAASSSSADPASATTSKPARRSSDAIPSRTSKVSSAITTRIGERSLINGRRCGQPNRRDASSMPLGKHAGSGDRTPRRTGRLRLVRQLSRRFAMHRKDTGGIAARAGRWSARHRKTAIIGWLAFILIAFALGNGIGPKKPTTAERADGESRRAEQVLDRAGLPRRPRRRDGPRAEQRRDRAGSRGQARDRRRRAGGRRRSRSSPT